MIRPYCVTSDIGQPVWRSPATGLAGGRYAGPPIVGEDPVGLRLAWLAGAGILVLFTLALTWIAVIPGLSAKSADGASAFSYPLIFLPFISSAFVLTDTMPGPVRVFAEYQPVTSIVNAIRGLFTQQPVDTDIWIALAWCVGILIVACISPWSLTAVGSPSRARAARWAWRN
jgi:ABC-type multidrug transport system permease subunit